jgi:hypothetical protein
MAADVDATREWLEGWCVAYVITPGSVDDAAGPAMLMRLVDQCVTDAAKEGMSRGDLDAAAEGDLRELLAERQRELTDLQSR